MAQYFRFCDNIHTLAKSNGLIICDTCKKIIGSINENAYLNILLGVICSCHTNGFIQFSETPIITLKKTNRIPDYENGVYVCRKCKTPLFSIISSRVLNYSFYFECKCGEVYDTRVEHHKNLAETLAMFKNKRAIYDKESF